MSTSGAAPTHSMDRTPSSSSVPQYASATRLPARQSYLLDPNRTKLKVNTTPAWARTAHDDDALFDNTQESPLTTKASRPSASTVGSSATASSSTPLRPPPLALRKAKVQRFADQVEVNGDDSSGSDNDDVSPRTQVAVTHDHTMGWPHLNHHSHDARREESHRPSGDWWQFTLPDKYKKKVEEYMTRHAEGKSATSGHFEGGDLEKQDAEKSKQYRLGATTPSTAGHHRRHVLHTPATPAPFSMHQAQTPGWASPWQPFINHHRDPFNEFDQRDVNRIPTLTTTNTETVWGKCKNFLLHHYMAPLTFRSLNIVFCSLSLALAARIKVVEDQYNLSGVIGTSTMYIIVVAPLSLVHIVVSLRVEYFGPPLGIWKVSSKMIFTLMELVFISVWSAALALVFDDEFTTSIKCTAWTPGGQYRNSQPLDATSQIQSAAFVQLCSLQSALVALVFCSVVLYAAVLIVALFRIFNKVNRKN